MGKYMGTFGVQYSTVPHPSGLPVHPDGWVEIEAEDMNEAITLMQGKYGSAYAFVYPEHSFKAHFHPLGAIDYLPGKDADAEGTATRDGDTL